MENFTEFAIINTIAEFYQISVDELLGYKSNSSLNSIYLQVKDYMQECDNPFDVTYKISRLAASCGTPSKFEVEEAKKIISGKTSHNLTYGQGDGGVRICGDKSVFVCSFKDLRDYDITTIRKVSKYLNKLNDFNTLKVLFALFSLKIEGSITESYTVEEIANKAKLNVDEVQNAFNNLDVYFDREEYKKTGLEKYSLEHIDQVPLLITLLIPTLDKYNNQIVD